MPLPTKEALKKIIEKQHADWYEIAGKVNLSEEYYPLRRIVINTYNVLKRLAKLHGIEVDPLPRRGRGDHSEVSDEPNNSVFDPAVKVGFHRADNVRNTNVREVAQPQGREEEEETPTAPPEPPRTVLADNTDTDPKADVKEHQKKTRKRRTRKKKSE